MTPIDKQEIVRMNRDTLYLFAIFDLDASPVTTSSEPVLIPLAAGDGSGARLWPGGGTGRRSGLKIR